MPRRVGHSYRSCFFIILILKENYTMAQATTFPTASFYSNTNVYYANGSDYIGECTWYAWGRAHEVTGQTDLPNKMAGSWYKNTPSGYTKRGPTLTPAAPGIGCFGNHVVFIEEVTSTDVKFSEANWYTSTDSRFSNGVCETPSTTPTGTDGQIKSLSISSFKNRSGGGTYQGCIVL